MMPVLQSLWLVDAVGRDEQTGKVHLSGMFNRIEVASGTDFTSPAEIFFSIRNVHGTARFNLMYVDLSDDAVLLERPIRVTADSPLETTDVSVRVNSIPVPHSGTFAWELWHADEVIGTARIEVTTSPDDGGEHGPYDADSES